MVAFEACLDFTSVDPIGMWMHGKAVEVVVLSHAIEAEDADSRGELFVAELLGRPAKDTHMSICIPSIDSADQVHPGHEAS